MTTVFITLLISFHSMGQHTCFENKQHPLPTLSDQSRKLYEANLLEAKTNYEKDSFNIDVIIWLGRRTAYLGNYQQAIDIFSRGIRLHPTDARLYRHRGHRYITLRCFEKAIGDFTKAADLIKGKPDEVEPDGMPNAQNIPTSTLQSNIWYHLGLCYFISGKYAEALDAYNKCLVVSKNNDMYVATANWLYITLRKLGKQEEAEKLLQTIPFDMALIENRDYHQVLLLYKQKPVWIDPLNISSQAKRNWDWYPSVMD